MPVKNIVSLLLIASSLFAKAQHSPVRFTSLLQGGLLEGEQGSALQLQTINGVQYKQWCAGVGIGLDYYDTRSIPVFVDVRRSFFKKENAPFVYVSGGYHFPWQREQDKLWLESDVKGGLYFDAGIGYQLPVLKSQQLFFSAGYSQKNFSSTVNTMPFISIWPAPPEAFANYEYIARRVSVKMGLRF